MRRIVAAALFAALPSSGFSQAKRPSNPLSVQKGAQAHALSATAVAETSGKSWSVPVLCYHQFGPKKRANPYKMSARQFSEELDWLKAQGYQAVTLSQIGAVLSGTGALPPKPVCITIDDGYASGWTVAGPVLKAHGFKASYFLEAKRQGRHGLLSWDQCRQMEKEGFEMGSHTCFHSNLGRPAPGESVRDYRARLRMELVESKGILERELGHPVDWLAYPYGAFNPLVESMARKAGYRFALTVTKGFNQAGSPPLGLNRMLILEPLSIQGFAKVFDFEPLPVKVKGLGEGSQWAAGESREFRLEFEPGFHPINLNAWVRDVNVPVTETAQGWFCTVPRGLKPGFHFLFMTEHRRRRTWQKQWLFQVIRPEWKPYMKLERRAGEGS
jgi:peptidoglycan/xylan/chitin deacetylase (PgdA/CDA1 family)